MKNYFIKFDRPAKQNYKGWEEEALPLGNGFIGAKLFGDIKREIIQYNEKSLWSGGPKPSDKDYNGGNYKNKFKIVKEVREYLDNGNIDKAREIAERELIGPNSSQYGRYLSFGNIYIENLDIEEDIDILKYTRFLDINNAIHITKYSNKKITYYHKTFINYPNNILVSKIYQKGSSLNLRIKSDISNLMSGKDEKSNYKTFSKEIIEEGIYLEGKVNDNDLKFASYLSINTDGAILFENYALTVQKATFVELYMNCKTDYAQNPLTNYRDLKIDLKKYVIDKVKVAKNKGYEKLLSEHKIDYQNLFNRLDFNISNEDYCNYAIDKIMSEYNNKQINYLEELIFQYGRYLLISSSRDGENALPANLQGIWNAIDNPPWNSDYHLNVNLQMNYWPAFVSNLSETSLPLIKYVDNLRYYGREAAKEYAGIESKKNEENGWLVNTQSTPFGWTTPGWDFYWGWAPTSNAWIMQNIYDYYKFTRDRNLLETKIYPMLLETVKFWNSFLHYHHKTDRYVSSPSFSPEHGDISIGNTYDQSLIYDLFNDYIEASKILGVSDELLENINEKIKKLNPININKNVEIKEWFEEDDIKFNTEKIEENHRHVSHLVGLYPGKIFEKNEKLLNAARKTLERRGDGGTGWSKANKINLWSRLYDGNRAHKLLSEQIKNSTLRNLWDTHPPYQIDGNFGATSGISEMLIHSHLEYIDLLPSLPDCWENGYIKGIVARGNFIFNIYWENKVIKKVEIKSNSGEILNLNLQNFDNYKFEKNDREIKVEKSAIKIPTNIGDLIYITEL